MSDTLPLPEDPQSLPPVLAGPLLRRLEPTRLVMWLVGSRALELTLRLQGVGDIRLDAGQCTVVAVGTHAFVHLIDVALDAALPCDELIEYDLLIDDGDGHRHLGAASAVRRCGCAELRPARAHRAVAARFLPQTPSPGDRRPAVRRSTAWRKTTRPASARRC